MCNSLIFLPQLESFPLQVTEKPTHISLNTNLMSRFHETVVVWILELVRLQLNDVIVDLVSSIYKAGFTLRLGPLRL